MKNSACFNLFKKTFCREIALFNSTRPPSSADKNALYVHSVDEPDPEVNELNNVEDEVINEGRVKFISFYSSC